MAAMTTAVSGLLESSFLKFGRGFGHQIGLGNRAILNRKLTH
jgi:hypothetical protein